MGVVYLLHFAQPIAPGRHTAQHYLGWASDLAARLAEHRAGCGARLTQVALERGIDWECVRTWPDTTRAFERQLKNRKETPRLCPVCHQIHARRDRPVCAAVQLELPIDDFPAPPSGLRSDWLEWAIRQDWRAARPAVAAPTGDAWDDGLL